MPPPDGFWPDVPASPGLCLLECPADVFLAGVSSDSLGGWAEKEAVSAVAAGGAGRAEGAARKPVAAAEIPGTTLLIAWNMLLLVKYVPRATWKGITTWDITIPCTDK